MWYNADGNITYNPEQAVDAIEYKDGRENITGGFGNTISYKGFTLDAFFQYSFGQWAFASTDYYFTRTPDFYSTMSAEVRDRWRQPGDRKSTRLNSSHVAISYAVFCLKQKIEQKSTRM